VKPWSEVYAALAALWREYWTQRDTNLHDAILLATREITARDQRIRELEAQLVAQKGPDMCPHCEMSCSYKNWPAYRRKKT
jgi:hypothetical protein